MVRELIKLLVYFSILLVAGCGLFPPSSITEIRKSDREVARHYEGFLPENEVAGVGRDQFYGRVEAIDGVSLESNGKPIYYAEVLPGSHDFLISCHPLKSDFVFFFLLNADLQAGHFYRVGCDSCFYTKNPKKVAVYIIDAESKKLIAGRSPSDITQWPYYCHTTNDPIGEPSNLVAATPIIRRDVSTKSDYPITYDRDLGFVTFSSALGKVRLNHEKHSAHTACNSCHPIDPPGKFYLTLGNSRNDRSQNLHKICVGCHKNNEGPTKCADCHNP